MVAKLDSTSTGVSGVTGSTLSWTHTLIGKASLIVVGIQAEFIGGDAPGAYATSVTFNGVGMTLIARDVGSGSHTSRVEMFALWGVNVPAAGGYTVAVTYPGNSQSRVGGGLAFKQTKGLTAEASTTANGNGGGSFGTNLTTVTGNALLISIYGSQNIPSATSTTGDTLGFTAVPGSGELSECDGFYRIAPTIGSNTVTLTVANPEGQAIILASFATKSGHNWIGKFL